ncbi:hypothetical protein PHAMO_180104 [Magnetospirillum molischianum DSM 120]|uniref:Uncharacterized protein n=1 Tax=Magnetospirillum molischianum DSM 120 TaxID=1150626 RepID=H8FP47_MAGML|nr:hypothetical protein PHAMO_180104 [Magnetospirillum molischianum DSM 120]
MGWVESQENKRYTRWAEELGGPLPEKRRRLLEMCLRMPDVRGAERDALVRDYYLFLRSDQEEPQQQLMPLRQGR